MIGGAIGNSVNIHAVITIQDTNNKVMLWLNSGYEEKETLKDLPILSNIEVTMKMGNFFQMSLALDMTYEQGMDFLNSKLIYPNNFVEAWIEYSDLNYSTMHFFGRSIKPEISISIDGITVNLPVVGVEIGAFGSKSNNQFEAIPLDIIKEIAEGEKYGMKVITSLGAEEALRNRDEKIKIEQCLRTDWLLILDICERFGCEMYSGMSKKRKPAIIIKKTDEWHSERPTKKFIMRGNIDLENQIYPLFSFSSPTNLAWLTFAANKTVSSDINPFIKKTEVNKIEENIQVDEKGREQQFISSSGRDEDLFKKKLKRHGDAVKIMGIKSTFTTIGIPNLYPAEVVEVIISHGGDKSIIDGNYAIEEVRHTASASGWDTEFIGFKTDFPAGWFYGERSKKVNKNKQIKLESGNMIEKKVKEF